MDELSLPPNLKVIKHFKVVKLGGVGASTNNGGTTKTPILCGGRPPKSFATFFIGVR